MVSETERGRILNTNVDQVLGRILGMRPLFSICEVFSEVRREESRKKFMLGNPSNDVITETSALVARGYQLTHMGNKDHLAHGVISVPNMVTLRKLVTFMENLQIGSHLVGRVLGILPP